MGVIPLQPHRLHVFAHPPLVILGVRRNPSPSFPSPVGASSWSPFQKSTKPSVGVRSRRHKREPCPSRISTSICGYGYRLSSRPFAERGQTRWGYFLKQASLWAPVPLDPGELLEVRRHPPHRVPHVLRPPVVPPVRLAVVLDVLRVQAPFF